MCGDLGLKSQPVECRRSATCVNGEDGRGMSMEFDQPYAPPKSLPSSPNRTLVGVLVFVTVFLSSLAGSLHFSRSTVSGSVVLGGFLLPDGQTTRISDIRCAGLPPWMGYQVHTMSSSGEYCATVYTSIDFPQALINIVTCLLLSAAVVLSVRRRTSGTG